MTAAMINRGTTRKIKILNAEKMFDILYCLTFLFFIKKKNMNGNINTIDTNAINKVSEYRFDSSEDNMENELFKRRIPIRASIRDSIPKT